MMLPTIMKPALRPLPSFLLPFSILAQGTQVRCAHFQQALNRTKARRPPPTTAFVPDVKTFLTLIGRSMNKYSDKIKTWRDLFTMSTAQFKGIGIEPPRNRRYLLRWREKFRRGHYGIGGDMRKVKDGAAELRILEVPVAENAPETSSSTIPKTRKIVVNLPIDKSPTEQPAWTLVPVRGVHIKGANTIVGRGVQPIKGKKGATVQVTEGLWEERRGRKIDGGERRRAEVAAKRRAEERRTAR